LFDAARFQIEQGDLIYNDMWARMGSVAIVPPDLAGSVASSHFPTFRLDSSKVVPTYLAWYFRTPSFWNDCENASRGSTGRNQIKRRTFSAIRVPPPTLAEQRRIVARIEELAEKVEEACKLQDESKRAISAFVSATHVDLSVSPPEPFSSFTELCEDQIPIEIGTPYPQAGVRGFGGGLFAKPPVYGGQTTYRAFNRLYSGALVMSQVKGWEGAVAMTPHELEGYFVSPEYRTFRCNEDRCLPEYLAALVPTEFFWSRLKDATRGVGARRERTRPEQFLQLKFSMPSLSDQKRAVAMFATISTVQEIRREIVPELNAMLPAILDKAFKGEL
jgi:type I restriction enzyme S subunit